jgi:hypothetical protein
LVNHYKSQLELTEGLNGHHWIARSLISRRSLEFGVVIWIVLRRLLELLAGLDPKLGFWWGWMHLLNIKVVEIHLGWVYGLSSFYNLRDD